MSNPNLIPTQVPDKRGFLTTRNKLPEGTASEANAERLDGLRADVSRASTQSSVQTPPLMSGDKVCAGEKVKVVLTYLEEGLNGEYDEDDESDVPLARVDVFVNKEIAAALGTEETQDGEWFSTDNHSICTRIDAREDENGIAHWLIANTRVLESAITFSEVSGKEQDVISDFMGWAESSDIGGRIFIDDLYDLDGREDPSRVVHEAREMLKELEESGDGFTGGELGEAAYLRRFLEPYNSSPDGSLVSSNY